MKLLIFPIKKMVVCASTYMSSIYVIITVHSTISAAKKEWARERRKKGEQCRPVVVIEWKVEQSASRETCSPTCFCIRTTSKIAVSSNYLFIVGYSCDKETKKLSISRLIYFYTLQAFFSLLCHLFSYVKLFFGRFFFFDVILACLGGWLVELKRQFMTISHHVVLINIFSILI